MLEQFPISARAAAIDIDRARRWYEEKLGLVPEHEDPGGLWYRFGGDTWLYLYGTPSAGTARNTIAGWTVTDIRAVMAGLRARGVTFEEYDLGDRPSHAPRLRGARCRTSASVASTTSGAPARSRPISSGPSAANAARTWLGSSRATSA